jgi:acyl-CoA synthetase (AMP-forming)/AMP-acid ligase II
MQDADTVQALLSVGASGAPAIGAPGRAALTYDALRDMVEQTGAALRAAGINRQDRVAIVLANGPEMAVAFLAVASVAASAPLNPSYKLEEFDFYLGDLGARALLVKADCETPARAAAAARNIPIFEVICRDGLAGAFTLTTPAGPSAAPGMMTAANPGDTALILHTSGTTARPKIVPLSQANLAASARNIAGTLALVPDDVCLNIMPLFHIHGLIAAVLASISVGASVVCAPGLQAFRFFNWFREARATWYTAVPTMHQTLLEIAPRYRQVIAEGRLRFIRSSSASLPPQVMAALEETYGVPVIEAYGMTEAAHQMASNPLPPAPRFAGSVGIAAGPEVAIMDEDGQLLPPEQPGEVVIRGRNVTAGYENNPDANAKSFTNGWFRTGDEGLLDAAGYLRLTGRLKEIINRAGEKVSPLEVDNRLMEHPSVKQVVTFAMPSRLFGEAVAAAVVLQEGATADVEGLRNFVAESLSAFKVPEKIVFLDEIPKGSTGKLQRVGLAQKLGLSD